MRKKDEMEQEISNKSIKITWFVTFIALFIIGITQRVKSDGGTNLFLIIASVSAILPIGLEHYYLSKVNDDNKFIKFIALFILFFIIMISAVMWFGR